MTLITEKKLFGFFQSLKSYLIKTQGSNEDLFYFFFSKFKSVKNTYEMEHIVTGQIHLIYQFFRNECSLPSS